MAMNIKKSDFERFADVTYMLYSSGYKNVGYESNKDFHDLRDLRFFKTDDEAGRFRKISPDARGVMPMRPLVDALRDWLFWSNDDFKKHEWDEKNIIDVDKMVRDRLILHWSEKNVQKTAEKNNNEISGVKLVKSNAASLDGTMGSSKLANVFNENLNKRKKGKRYRQKR